MNAADGYIYVLHGENDFAVEEAAGTIKQRLRAQPGGEHNITSLGGAEATFASVREAADAVPFLADRRLVVVSGLLARLQGKGAARRPVRGKAKANSVAATDEWQALLDYLRQVPRTSSIAFVESVPLDTSDLQEAIPKARAHIRAYPRVADAARWVRQRARVHEADLDESAVRELAALGSDDPRRLDTEVRKLATFGEGRTVTREDVRELVVGRDLLNWALVDALVDRRGERALVTLRRLLAQGETPEALLGRDLAPLYRRLLIAKEISLLPASHRARVDVAALGLNPKTISRSMEQAARFERAELERAVQLLRELDRSSKTGETDLEVALELAIVELCSRLSVVGA